MIVDHLDVVDCKQRRRHLGDLTREGQLSLAQSRGVMFLSLAYFSADCSTIGRSSFWSGVSQSETKLHFLPSHCWMRTFEAPS